MTVSRQWFSTFCLLNQSSRASNYRRLVNVVRDIFELIYLINGRIVRVYFRRVYRPNVRYLFIFLILPRLGL